MDESRFYKIINQFEQTNDQAGQRLNMRYLAIQKDDEVFEHGFDGFSDLCDVRSISKTVMALVLGMIIERSRQKKYPPINEKSNVYPFLKDIVTVTNASNLEFIKQIKIEHLLTHSIGYRDMLMMRNDIKDLDPHRYVDMVINHPIIDKPGEAFLYSNAGFFLLSVILQHLIDEDLIQFIQRELFEPLGIHHFRWEKYGDYCAGATRLWLNAEDLLKIGQLMLLKGTYDGRQLVSSTWIDKMIKLKYHTPNYDDPSKLFRLHGYGYGIWLTDTDIYFGYGTDGQFLVMIPKKKMIIVTLAEHKDVVPIMGIIDDIIRNET